MARKSRTRKTNAQAQAELAKSIQVETGVDAKTAEIVAEQQAEHDAEAAAGNPTDDTERTDAEIAAEMLEDEEPVIDLRKSIVPPKYKAAYGKKEHCGDDLGYAISAVVRDGKGQIIFEALNALALENGLNLDRWAGLNPGQKSMNLRNVLRGRVKRGEAVVVAGQQFSGPVQMTDADL